MYSEKLPFDVSRETLERLGEYQQMLQKWTAKINLISKSTVEDTWNRHIVDSAQIFPLIRNEERNLVDFGSGGGLPAIVLSILSHESHPDRTHVLLESDLRKATFLREVVRCLSLRCEILNKRVEGVDPLRADLVTARAFAPMGRLLEYSEPHLKENARAIFLKGREAAKELREAKCLWSFDVSTHTSMTAKDSVVLILEGIRRAG